MGKSTLFNRLVGQRKAIVDATAGTTRDRHYGKTDWNGREFSVIDTGGYSVNSDDIFEDDIRRQVMLAIEEADVILFLVEVNTGITDLDQMMADILRRTSKKVLLVCNKVDNYDLIYSSHEFYSLGLGEPYCISSMSGSGTGDLMDEIVRDLPPETKNEEEELPRITIVGRPNVGKSSLTNALLGEERNDRRHHARRHSLALQQVRTRFLPGRYGRHAQKRQGDRRPRILLRDAFDPRHRGVRRLHPDARCAARPRIPGPEHP